MAFCNVEREHWIFFCYAEEINMIPYIVYDKSNLYAEEKKDLEEQKCFLNIILYSQ